MSAAVLGRPPVRRVADALAQHGLADRVVALADSARTAADAARALAVPVGAIVKSLVFAAGERVVLACVAGDRRVDAAALAASLDVAGPLERAPAALVKATTGFSIGGVAPVGHVAPVAVVLDASLARFAAVFAAAGHPHAVFRTSLAELERVTGGRVDAGVAVAAAV
ncbi:MAG: YbaK/EbsC family protein [Alphaproteobacteria bacterium]